jgi:hypothetical protein
MTILLTPAWLRVAMTRWATEMEPMLSMGLNSPIRVDIPAATINAPICIKPLLPNHKKKQVVMNCKFYIITICDI